MSEYISWKHFDTWDSLTRFLNQNDITKERIVNISFCINYISLLYV